MMFFRTIVLVLVTSSKVDITPSVPTPEYLYPPKGISKLLKKLAPLMTVPPHSSALQTLTAVFMSAVNTQPQRPNFDPFAISIASSTVSNSMTGTTGPNISMSLATSAVLGTPAMTVGVMNAPFLSPPRTILPPCSTVRSICSLTLIAAFSLMRQPI